MRPAPDTRQRREARAPGAIQTADQSDHADSSAQPLALALGEFLDELARAAVRRDRDRPIEQYRLRAREAGWRGFHLAAAHLAVAGGAAWATETLERWVADLNLVEVAHAADALLDEVKVVAS
jgi:hypothetical protein